MTTLAARALNTVIGETIARVLTRVNAITLGGPGYTRPSYSDEESAAHAVIEDEARALGLEVRRDPAGNLFARLAGRDGQSEAGGDQKPPDGARFTLHG